MAGQDILDVITAAVGCQQCGAPLGDSPSDDFCCAEHQEMWHAALAEPLIGYSEPWDPAEFMASLQLVFEGIGRAVAKFSEALLVAVQPLPMPSGRRDAAVDAWEQAIQARRCRNTGPALPRLDRRH